MWFLVCISWTTTTAQIIFICFWKDILRKDDAIFPHTLRADFLDPHLMMRDTFSLAAFLSTTWHVTGFGVTKEMTRRPYGITLAT